MDLILCCFVAVAVVVVLAYRLIFKYSTQERKKVTHAVKECESIPFLSGIFFQENLPIIHFKCDSIGFMLFEIAIILRLFRKS